MLAWKEPLPLPFSLTALSYNPQPSSFQESYPLPWKPEGE